MRVEEEKPTRADPSPPDPFLGQVVGGCRIDEVIGRGGMGVVYKATQLSLNRPVAIKVLPEEVCGQPQFVERFKREVDVLSRLSHPNVVTVFERGAVDGRLYVIMEYVQGTSLREVMRKGPLPAAEALVIVRGVLSALEHAHGKGIIHRDIKPENVLVAAGGIVKVADFGLSRLLGPQGATRLTHTALLLGTFEYMAPEQREKAREADERADIYATGVVLYEMLAGELPIGHFAALSRKRPRECDSRIDAIVEKSLAKSPSERYQRASEMGAAVSRVLSAAAMPEAPPATEPAPPRDEPVRGKPERIHVAAKWSMGEEEERGPRGRRGKKDDPANGVGCLVFLIGLVVGLGLLKSAILAIAVLVAVRALPAIGTAAKWATLALCGLAIAGVFLLSGVRSPTPDARADGTGALHEEETMAVVAHWTAGRRAGFVEKISKDPAALRWVASELDLDPAVLDRYRLVSWDDRIVLIGPRGGWPGKAAAAFARLVQQAATEVGGAVTLESPVAEAEFKTSPPRGLATGGAD